MNDSETNVILLLLLKLMCPSVPYSVVHRKLCNSTFCSLGYPDYTSISGNSLDWIDAAK